MEKDNKEPVITEKISPDMGKSDASTIDASSIEDPKAESNAEDTDYTLDTDVPDTGKAIESKKAVNNTKNDFYDKFIDQQEAAEFAEDLQSADTYWENRPQDRVRFEEEFGDQAKEKFTEYYDTKIEPVWREKLSNQTDLAAINSEYEWLFGDRDDVSYDVTPVVNVVREISNGSRRIGSMITDTPESERLTDLGTKTYMNDQGELVKLEDDEKWWMWSKGKGFEMNYQDPKHMSVDGREIIGFTYEKFPEEYRGDRYIKAVYENDIVTEEVVSLWDTTNIWLLSNATKDESKMAMLPRTAIRTVIGAASGMITGTVSLMGSVAQLMDSDDKSAFIDWTNNTVVGFNSIGNISKSDYNREHPYSVGNMIDMVADIAAQLISMKAIFNGTMGLTKLLLAKNPLLTAAKAAEAGGDVVKAGKLISQFEMTHGLASRSAGLLGMVLQTGADVVTEARAAGFGEDEAAAIYLAYFGMMLGANQISMRMLDPYMTKAAFKPLAKQIIKDAVPKAEDAVSDLAKLSWAKKLVKSLGDAASKVTSLPTEAGHASRSMAIRSIMYKSANEALEEEVEFFGQEAVELFATMISEHRHKGDKEIARFDTFREEGYWARQLPEIIMSGVGGAIGGAMTHVLPGFSHNNEHSFLLQGENSSRLMRIGMEGGHTESMFMNHLNKQKKAGALGSSLLSIKLNDKTDTFYKMTDPEAKGTMSHAEAAYTSIVNQLSYYKTLYGGSNKTYDEAIEQDPTIKKDLEDGSGHVMYKQLINLHNTKRELLDKVLGRDKGADAKAAKAKEESPKKKSKKKPVEDKETPGSKPGLVAEPEVETKEEVAKAQQVIEDDVQLRADLYGTTNYEDVASILKIERDIDNILSGNAVAQQYVKSVIRNNKIDVFTKEGQKTALSKITDANGKEIDSPFAALGDNLFDMLFSADANLAKGHKVKHSAYIENAEIIKQFVDSDMTLEEFALRAEDAREHPGSVAINPDSDQLKKLAEGVDKLALDLISKKDFEAIVLSTRTSLGLRNTTEEYQKQLNDQYYSFRDNDLKELDADDRLTKEQIAEFTDNNLALVHKVSLSSYLDVLETKPTKFLAAEVNLDKKDFRDAFIKSVSAGGDITVEGNPSTFNPDKFQTEIDALGKEIGKLTLNPPKDSASLEKHERALGVKKLTKLKKEEELIAATKSAGLSGALNLVIGDYGASVLFRLGAQSPVAKLVPLVKVKSEDISKAKKLIKDYQDIVSNISPVVPTVQKSGAVYNLLNEISTNGTSVLSTISKMISIDDADDVKKLIYDATGKVISTNPVTSKISQLKAQVLNSGTGMAEFRNLDAAKLLLDGINIRLAQVQVIALTSDKLSTLRAYTRKHIPEGDTKYDHMPRFMAEHIYDSERLDFLKNKASKTPEERADLDEIVDRRKKLISSDDPNSVLSRLFVAKAEVEQLIELGEKSQDSNERLRIYKTEVAEELNRIKRLLPSNFNLDGLSKPLDKAISEFDGTADTYEEGSAETLVLGRNALQNILQEVSNLPNDVKKQYLEKHIDRYTDNANANSNMERSIINAMATDMNVFDEHYNKILATSVKGIDGAHAPTYAQENMIHGVFSFITDANNVFPNLKSNKKSSMLMVDGSGGVGKTAMVGYGLATAQSAMDKAMSDSMGKGFKKEDHNQVLFAGNYSEQATALKGKATAIGVRAAVAPALNKRQLFDFLNKNGSFDNIGVIVFDEATFIQAEAEEGKISELESLQNRLNEINILRAGKKIPPIKFIAIGDDQQGGWQVGMPTVFDMDADLEAPLDYSKLGTKPSLISNSVGMMYTRRLTYPFRSSCEKIREISEDMLEMTSRNAIDRFVTGKAITTKLIVSSGSISNDDRKRLGGVSVSRSNEDLYNDQSLADNIVSQLKEDDKFSVLIVDNDRKGYKDLPKDSPLIPIIKKYPSNFKFRTIESVQGGEADYVIANLVQLFPKIPIANAYESNKIQKAAMVIARARLFAKISVDPTINIEEANNTIITMLPEKDAAILSSTWNEFYLDALRKVGEPIAKPVITTEESSGDKAEDSPKIEPEDRPIPKRAENAPLAGTNGSEVIAHSQVIVSDAAVLVDPNAPTTQDNDVLDKAKAAALNNETITKKKKEKLLKDIDKRKESIVDFIDTSDKPAPYSEGIESIEADVTDMDADVTTTDQKKPKQDAAKEHVRALEKQGYIIGFNRMKPWKPIAENDLQIGYFASDVYGSIHYKGKDAGTMRPIVRDAVTSARKALMDKDFSKHQFFLMSFETYDTDKKEMVMAHQIHTNGPEGIRIPIARIPALQLDVLGKAHKEFTDRGKVVKNAAEAMGLLHSTDPELFGTKGKKGEADNIKAVFFGNSGEPMSDEVISKIQSILDEKHPGITFPTNSAITKFGRTSLSDQSEKYIFGRGKKMTPGRKDIGTFYLETEISDPAEVFAGMTGGKPITNLDSDGIMMLGDLPGMDTAYLDSLPSEVGRNKSVWYDVDASILNGVEKTKNGNHVSYKVTKESIARIDGDPEGPLYKFNIDDEKYSMLSVKSGTKSYRLITIKGRNDRGTTLFSDGRSGFKILLGFDSSGKPIELKPNDLDLEGKAFIKTLGTDQIGPNIEGIVSKAVTPDQANAMLAEDRLYNYDLKAVMATEDPDVRYRLMSKEYLKTPIIDSSEFKISFGNFRKLSEERGIKISRPMVQTKTKADKHRGQAFVLYTHDTNPDKDLSDPDKLSRILANMSKMNKSDVNSEDFNVLDYARNGIGVIWLDIKPKTLRELINRASYKDINRATSPPNSEANKRMIVFSKELAQIIQTLDGRESTVEQSRLDKLGMIGNDPISTVFDDAGRERLTAMLTKLKHTPTTEKQYESLAKLMTTVTLDKHMGHIALAYLDPPGRFRELFSMKTVQEKQEYWNEITSQGLTEEEATFADGKNFEENGFNLYKEATDSSTRAGEISGGVLLNKHTGQPLILNNNGAISFVPEIHLLIGEEDTSVGGRAVFNMSNFLKMIKLRSISGDSELGAESLAGLLDEIMKDYTVEGSLRKGVMWSGKLSTELDQTLGVAMLDLQDADDLLQTNVKEISLPTSLIHVSGLIKQLHSTKVQERNQSEKEEEVVELSPKQRKKKVESDIANIKSVAINDAVNAVDYTVKARMRNTAVQDIVKEYSGISSLFETDIFTRMVSKDIKAFRTAFDKKHPNLEAKKISEKAVKIFKTGSAVYLTSGNPDPLMDRRSVELMAHEDVTALMDEYNIVKQARDEGTSTEEQELDIRTLKEALLQLIREEPRLDSIREELELNINTQVNTVEMEIKTEHPGKVLLNAISDTEAFIKEATEEQKEVLTRINKTIDNLELTSNEVSSMEHLINLAVHPEVIQEMGDAEGKIAVTSASTMQLSLFGKLLKQGFSNDDIDILGNIFELMQKTKC